MKRKPSNTCQTEPEAGEATYESFCLVVPSQLCYLNLVAGLAKRAAMVAGLDDADSSKVSIAVDEAVTNVITHAYHGEPQHQVEINLHFVPSALEVHIWHSGQGLRDKDVVLPDARDYLKQPRKGGLGLLLMSRFMDEIHFDSEGDRFECCMVKRVS